MCICYLLFYFTCSSHVSHIVSSYITSYYIILHYVVLFHIISYYIMSYYFILYHITLCHIILYRIISYYIILHYVILYYIILCQASWSRSSNGGIGFAIRTHVFFFRKGERVTPMTIQSTTHAGYYSWCTLGVYFKSEIVLK